MARLVHPFTSPPSLPPSHHLSSLSFTPFYTTKFFLPIMPPPHLLNFLHCDLTPIKAAESTKIQALYTHRPLSNSASCCIIKALHSLTESEAHGMSPCVPICICCLWLLHQPKLLSKISPIAAYVQYASANSLNNEDLDKVIDHSLSSNPLSCRYKAWQAFPSHKRRLFASVTNIKINILLSQGQASHL